MLGITILVLAIILLAFIVKVLNKINTYKVKIDEAYSSIEIYLAKRYDVLKQSYECVKGYTKHESEVLTKLVEIRQNMPISQLQEAANSQEAFMNHLKVAVENYPNLKADTVFCNLQNQLVTENEHLSAAKRVYNSNVSIYNQYVVTIPVCFIAPLVGGFKKEFFKEEGLEEKKNISFTF